jgi:hypothetical protein
MEALPPHQEPHALPTRSVPTQARLEIHSMEISTVMTERVMRERREVTDEELELIEMRYQQALAIQNLEPLFAEGLLDCD